MKNYKDARKKIASWIRVNHDELAYILYEKKIANFYKSFMIPKKNGKSRVIYAPQDELKIIQKKISQKLCETHSNYKEQHSIKSTISHGYEQERTIITNARNHKNKKYLLNIDISNFFSSFNFA